MKRRAGNVIAVRLPVETVQALRQRAAEEGRTLSAVIRPVLLAAATIRRRPAGRPR